MQIWEDRRRPAYRVIKLRYLRGILEFMMRRMLCDLSSLGFGDIFETKQKRSLV